MRKYNIFISHSWKYHEHYEALVKFFDQKTYFDWSNYSVPKTNPIDSSTNKALTEALIRKISPCSVVIVIAGQYSTYSDWINKEIELAKVFNKPIIAIIPRGNERPSAIVQENAKVVVGWNVDPIVKAIKDYSL